MSTCWRSECRLSCAYPESCTTINAAPEVAPDPREAARAAYGSLAETRAALRTELGPPTERDSQWQPMIAASEVRQLLDALDELEHQVSTRGPARDRLLSACRTSEVYGRPTVTVEVATLREALG